MSDKELREFLGLMNENWVCVCEGCTRAKKNIRTLIDRQPTEEEAIMVKEMLLESEKDYCCCPGCKRKGDIIRKALGIEEGK